MTGRRWRHALIVVVLVGLGFVPVLPEPELATGAYLQAVTTGAAVVRCATGAPAPRGLVVRRDDREVFRSAPGVASAWHGFHVGDLEPGTGYDYELLDAGGAPVDGGRFVTRSDADTAAVRFAVLGDSGDQPFWIDLRGALWTRGLRAVGLLPEMHPDPAAVGRLLAGIAPPFWLHTGDVVYPRGELRHYHTGFFLPFGAMLGDAPCYPVAGNHDVMSAGGEAFDACFELPNRAADGRHWTFRDGPVRFVGLDLNERIDAEHPALRFLEAAAAHGEPWLIVLSHYPVHTVYRPEPREDLLRHLLPRCRALGVDLLFAGHDHLYQRFGKPAAKGPIEIGTGGGGKDLYAVRRRPEELAVAVSAHHVCVVEVDGVKLTCEARSVGGEVLDRFTIDKAAALVRGPLPGPPQRTTRAAALQH